MKSYGVNKGKMNLMISTFRAIYMLGCSHYRLIAHKAVITQLYHNTVQSSGFGGLVVSVLASGTQDRGFEPGRSRQIFRVKKSSTRLSSEGK